MSSPLPNRPVRVLSSVSARARTSGYVVPLEESYPKGVTALSFSWPRAIFGRYDVFHVHWPEYLLRHPRPAIAAAKRVLLEALLLRLRLLRVPIVRTMHNVAAHDEGNSRERGPLARLDSYTAFSIVLNESTPIRDGQPSQLIPHGHYVHLDVDRPREAAEAGRILYFGLIKPYKAVDTLIDAFMHLDDDALTLRLVGSPSTRSLREMIEQAVQSDPRISAHLAYVDDDQLSHEIARAELAVLPYREMHNSGAVLRALSLGRPVLVPESAPNTALSAEVGPGWVVTYRGALNGDVLRQALESARLTPDLPPVLDARDWSRIGVQHYEVFRRALSAR